MYVLYVLCGQDVGPPSPGVNMCTRETAFQSPEGEHDGVDSTVYRGQKCLKMGFQALEIEGVGLETESKLH